MKRTRQQVLSCEGLEDRSLLSGVTGGAAGLTVSPAPSSADTQWLLQVTSTNNLAMFL